MVTVENDMRSSSGPCLGNSYANHFRRNKTLEMISLKSFLQPSLDKNVLASLIHKSQSNYSIPSIHLLTYSSTTYPPVPTPAYYPHPHQSNLPTACGRPAVGYGWRTMFRNFSKFMYNFKSNIWRVCMAQHVTFDWFFKV